MEELKKEALHIALKTSNNAGMQHTSGSLIEAAKSIYEWLLDNPQKDMGEKVQLLSESFAILTRPIKE